MSYRNICYFPKEELIRLFTWDGQGKRIALDFSYNPYLYLETNQKGDAMSIFNTHLKKRNFRNQFERRKYINETGNKRLFENLSPSHQFLVDTYWKDYEKEEFIQHPLKVGFLDIETYSVDEFPKTEDPTHTINIITIYDSIREHFYSWGLKPFNKLDNKQTYFYCKTEKELLLKFVEFMSKDHFDVLSGWNSEIFDIPYLINRIIRVCGEGVVEKLSPVGRVYNRSIRGKFGREQIRWYIEGVSCIDYLDVYKRFCLANRDSYKLDNIANIELGESKVDYGEQNLSTLADTNWETFVDYNIQDVRLLVKLEDTLQYIGLLRQLSHIGLTTLEAAMGSMTVIIGACAIRARQRDQKIPTFIRPPDDGSQNEGAFVKIPEKGFQKNVVSFDANSLYPNTMITLNLSPETKIGNIVHKNIEKNVITIKDVNNKVHDLTLEKFKLLVEKEKLAISKAGVLFSQKKKGLIPEIVDNYYKLRVTVRKELKKLKKSLAEAKDKKAHIAEINRLNIKQQTIKVLINSIYGAFGNKVFPLGDDDLARSITLTGQAVIKAGSDILNSYIKDRLKVDELKDQILYIDTDSLYLSLNKVIEKEKIPSKNGEKLSKELHNLVEEITTHLNEEIVLWGNKELNSVDCRLEFKREKICDVAMFLEKKRYILHVLDNEGIEENAFKYTGVEIARTTMPKPIKPYVKKIIETMLMTQSYSETNKVIEETHAIFKELKVEDVSLVMGVKGYEKYSALCNNFDVHKGTPVHVKSAYYHNLLLDKLDIGKKYEKIGSGDKIRFFYVKTPNKYGIKSMAFKYYYPEEFNAFIQVDYEKMFDKIIYSVVERMYENVGWQPKKPGENTQLDLFEFFKE